MLMLRWFNGGICEMSIWNRVLTHAKKLHLYTMSGAGTALG